MSMDTRGSSRFIYLIVALVAAASCSLAMPAWAQLKTTLTVYTPLEKEQLGPYKRTFEKDNPTISTSS